MRNRILPFGIYLALIFSLGGCEKAATETTEQRANSSNQQGLDFFNKGQYSEAIEKFTNSIELKPSDDEILFEAYFNRGHTHSKLNQHNYAIDDYSKAIELKPEFAESFYHRSIAYYHVQNYKPSLDDYLKTTRMGFKSTFPDGMKNGLRGFCVKTGDEHFVKGEYQIAIENYKKVTQIDQSFFTKEIKQKCAKAYYALGKKHLAAKKYDEAIAKFKEADGLTPNANYKSMIANTLIVLAEQEEKKEEYQSAVTHYEEALKYAPEKRAEINSQVLTALITLAQREERSEDYQSAIEHYRDALQYAPEMGDSINEKLEHLQVLLRAQILSSLAKLKAITERLLRLGENSSPYEINPIIRDLERLMVALKAEPHAWFILGMAKALRAVKEKERYGRGIWNFEDDGEKEFRKAIDLKEDFAEAHIWLGAVIARQGIESAWGEDEKLSYSLILLYQMWRNGWSDNWRNADYLTSLPYSARIYLDDANKEWRRAIELDHKMREVFRAVVTKIFADFERR